MTMWRWEWVFLSVMIWQEEKPFQIMIVIDFGCWLWLGKASSKCAKKGIRAQSGLALVWAKAVLRSLLLESNYCRYAGWSGTKLLISRCDSSGRKTAGVHTGDWLPLSPQSLPTVLLLHNLTGNDGDWSILPVLPLWVEPVPTGNRCPPLVVKRSNSWEQGSIPVLCRINSWWRWWCQRDADTQSSMWATQLGSSSYPCLTVTPTGLRVEPRA